VNKQPQIQFNLTLAALNALIEAQPEAKTKLTHGVIENFAKQHLIKAFQSDPHIMSAMTKLKNEVQVNVLNDIGITGNTWIRDENIVIAERHVVNIKKEIQRKADNYIKDAIAAQLADLQTRIDDTISKHITEAVNLAVRNRLRLVEANIRELTEAIPLKRTVDDTTRTS